jgi:hypothetical protein
MIYLMGSMRSPRVRDVAAALRARRLEVFDDWHAPGPETDIYWQDYETSRGRTYLEALKGAHARNVCEFDKKYLDLASAGVMVMPAGKSAHMELGYMIRSNKPSYILLEHEPDTWDIMYRLATDVFYHIEDLVEEIAG